MKRLIVNADDYGHTAGLSRGILEGHRQGIVTSASVMIGSPGSARAIHVAAVQTAPTLGLGLHLTLTGTGNRPILPAEQVPSLVQGDGTFYPLSAWLDRYAQFAADEMAQEFAAQCERFATVAGKLPDHLDAHHHVAYRHPGGLSALFHLAHHYRVPVRNAGFDDDGLWELVQDVPGTSRVDALASIKVILAQQTPVHPDHFVTSFYDKTASLDELLDILANLPDGVTELMCHPGYADAALISDYTAMREVELAALTDARARTLITAQAIKLINFSHLQ